MTDHHNAVIREMADTALIHPCCSIDQGEVDPRHTYRSEELDGCVVRLTITAHIMSTQQNPYPGPYWIIASGVEVRGVGPTAVRFWSKEQRGKVIDLLSTSCSCFGIMRQEYGKNRYMEIRIRGMTQIEADVMLESFKAEG